MKPLLKTLSLTLVTGLALAQSDLEQVWLDSVQADTSLAGAQIQHEIAKAQVNQGLGMLLPNVSANASSSWSGSDADIDWDNETLTYGVTLAQPLYYQNAIFYYNAFKNRAVGQEHALEAASQQLVLDVINKYFDVLRAQDALVLSRAELKAVERQLEQTEKHYEVGLVAITDVLDAKASYSASRVNQISAEANYQNALQSLTLLTGKQVDSVIALPDSFLVKGKEVAEVETWLDIADQQHPAILAERQNLKYMTLSKKAKASERLPTVDAVFNYSHCESNCGMNGDGASSSFRLGVTLPIFTGGQTSAEIRQAGLNLNAAEQGYEQLKRNIELNIRLVHRQLTTDRLNLEAQAQAVESRESALKATEVGYEVGTRNIVEVLNAQRALFGSKLQFRMAQYDLLIGELRLKQAAGNLAIEDLKALNQLLQR